MNAMIIFKSDPDPNNLPHAVNPGHPFLPLVH